MFLSPDFSEIKSFVTQNGIIVAIAGITIGSSTKDMLKALIIDLIMPLLYAGIFKKWIKKYDWMKNLSGSSNTPWHSFAKEFISWLLTLAISYVLIVYFLNKIFISTNSDKKIEEENKKFFR